MINISKYEYVSFDIFDTIVNRNLINPKDLYDIVQIKYNMKNEKINNFRESRMISQKKTYEKSPLEEVTIDEIYENLSEYYPKEVCEKLKKIEKETEINICTPNIENINFYNEVLKTKKTIITSDMYLDRDTIEKILDKCQIKNYEKLYLSSELKKRKSRGSMYKFIEKDLGTKNILHVGNDFISDYLMAKLNGISSKKIKIMRNNNFFDKKNKNINYRELETFISNNLKKEDYYYDFGYECFGPILYYFSKWLTENIKTEKKFFLARDGFLIQKAYNLYNEINDNHYFYASRRSLIVPTLWMEDDLKSMTDKLYIRDSIKIGNLFRKLGLENGEFKKIVKKYGYEIDRELNYKELFADKIFKNIFEEVKPLIYKNSKKEYELLIKYMEQEKFSGDVSIIDIGWNGNMQVAFKNILRSLHRNDEIYGYYVGVLRESKNIGKVKMYGCLFDEKEGYDIYICLKVINSIFESMFLAPHGSVKKFKVDKRIVPVLYNYEYDENVETKSYKQIQEGALKFIEDFRKSDLNLKINLTKETVFASMMKFAYKPKILDTKMFGDFKFLEDDVIYIAKPKSLIYYIFHPKILFKDVYTSGWLIGFMKRLTKINIFYTKLYKIYIKKYLEKRRRDG